MEIFSDALVELRELQKCLHQGWKGHGPEVLEEGIGQLLQMLDLKATEEAEFARLVTDLDQLEDAERERRICQRFEDHEQRWGLPHWNQRAEFLG